MIDKKNNKMRNIRIEKVVLSVGGTGDILEKGVKLLKLLTGRTPSRRKSRKRIPTLGVRPGLEVGAVITIRKNPEEVIKKMLIAVDNIIRKRQVSTRQEIIQFMEDNFQTKFVGKLKEPKKLEEFK